jgi:hypothetical protein
MGKNDMWGKIRKTVTEGVAIAAEKTEEYAKLGKAKLDILATRRKISQKRTELGGIVYAAMKDGKEKEILTAKNLKSLVGELDTLETELARTKKQYDTMKKKAQADFTDVKKAAETGVKDLTARAKTKVSELKNKSKPKKQPAPKAKG